MVDQWGRPTLETGMKIAQFGMQVQDMQRRQEAAALEKEQKEQLKQDRAAFENYSALISAGKVPEQEIDPKTINHKALAEAYAKSYATKLHDIGVRKAEFELSAAKAMEAKRVFTENIRRAEALASNGNDTAAAAYYVEAYKYINNGDNIEFDPSSGKSYRLVPGEDGTLTKGEEVALPTREQMQKMARDMLDKNNFEQTYVSQRLNNKAINVAAFENPVEIVDTKGNHAGWMVRGVDPDMGTPDWKVSLGDNRMMSFAEARKKGYMTRDDWAKQAAQNLELAKKQADIAYTTAQHGKATSESLSQEEKLARAFVRAAEQQGKKMSLEEALDKVMEGKAKSDKFRVLIEEKKDGMWDFNSREGQEMIRFLGLEDYFPKLKGGPGLQTKPAAEKEQESTSEEKPPIPGARKAPDGKWYVNKDNKWYLVKGK